MEEVPRRHHPRGCAVSGSTLRRRRGGKGSEGGEVGGGGVAARVAQTGRRGGRELLFSLFIRISTLNVARMRWDWEWWQDI